MENNKRGIRIGAALIILIAAVAAFTLRPAAEKSTDTSSEQEVVSAALPRLLDLGADKCVPCKMMAPILEEIKEEFADNFTVEFIDVWKNPDTAKPFSIRVIPTQIFFAADGTELFRHEGFFSREDILAKWKELGIDLPNKGA